MRAVIGLGGNLGDPPEAFRQARARLAASAGVQVLASAPLYRSFPHGDPDQPWYWNSALLLETALDAHVLLRLLLAVEAELGRRRDGKRWAPRLIDLDLLAWGEARIHAPPDLIVPHPRLTERRFALQPFVDLWPDWRHPVYGMTAQALLQACPEPESHLHAWGDWDREPSA